MKLSLILLGLGLALCVQSEPIRYDNYKVVRFIPSDAKELKLLNELQNSNFGVLFWSEPSRVGKPVDIMFPPHLQGDTFEFLQKRMSSRVLTNNVQSLIQQEAKGILEEGKHLDWDSYGTITDIYEFLDEAASAHNGVAQVLSIGTSYENQELKVIKIAKPAAGNEEKPAIWIDAGIHAREWISPAVGTYVINELLNSTEADTVKITDDFDVYVMPVMNPDGYRYTHTTNRLWRKTRSVTPSPLGCRGADANRNWDYEFNTGGSSNLPCQDTYHGGVAFGEKETKAASDFYNTIANQTKMFLSIHSYSQYILLPYGYSADRYPDYNAWMDIANATSAAIKRRHGTEFEWGNIVDLLYVSSGGSVDWIKGIHDTNIVLAFELRDTGRNGFILPPEQIKPSGEEFMDGLKELVSQLRRRLGMQ